MEQLDLQQFHVWTDAWAHNEEWRRAIEDLKASGKIRFIGISITEHEPDSALETLRTGLIDAVQVIYNVFDQTPEAHLFPLCQELNLGVLARVPLDEGGLTGTITEQTKFEPGEFRDFYFRGDRKRQVVEHVEALKKDLAGVEGTLPEIALRFCLITSGRLQRHPRHAAYQHRGKQLRRFGPRPAVARRAGDSEEARLVPQLLPIKGELSSMVHHSLKAVPRCYGACR